MKHLVNAVLLFSLAAVVSLPASAISIRSLLGLDDEEETTEEPAQQKAKEKQQGSAKQPSTNWAKTRDPAAIDLEFIKRLLINLDTGKGRELIANEKAFAQFVRQETRNHSVLSAAKQNKLDEDENTVFLMRRGAENILREIYLNRLISEKLPKDFPTEAQVKEYHEKNQDKLVIPEKVHVWQVFFPVDKDMDQKAIAALKKKANAVADNIRRNKTSFNDAGVKH